jgi:hypothetical protein
MEFGYIMKTLTVQLLKENLEALKLELGVGAPEFVTDCRPEVRDTGNIILDSAYLAVATLQGVSH